MPQSAPFTLHGPRAYRLKSLATFLNISFRVPFRRLLRGPRRPSWDTNFEIAIEFMRAQGQHAHRLPTPAESRAYEDSFLFAIPALEQVKLTPVTSPVRGHWYDPRAGTPPGRTLLYLHGGGYNFYAKGHASLISLTALAARARTFALDYRLAPEHPYPAALDDARAAYGWLLDQGVSPQNLILAGDSAGGNLTLVLLLALREANLPLPALAVCLAPWTDLTNPGTSMTRNAPYDWISKPQADHWAKAYYGNANPQTPLISPVYGNFAGMPPIYIQAGDSEILFDMIRTFADTTQAQGANVRLDVWKDMPHDFQAFGDTFPASKDALRRLGEVVDEHVHPTNPTRTLLQQFPPLPRWVEARSLLLAGPSEITAYQETPLAFVLRDPEDGTVFVVGHPPVEAVQAAVQQNPRGDIISEYIPAQDQDWLTDALPPWPRARIIVYTPHDLRLPETLPPGVHVGFLDPLTLPTLPLDDELREDLQTGAETSKIAATFVDEQPVAFCYAGAVTETMWDVAIDTLPAHRRKGYAALCAAYMIRHMQTQGKHPVWQALEDNPASWRLAEKLGFKPVDELALFEPPEDSE